MKATAHSNWDSEKHFLRNWRSQSGPSLPLGKMRNPALGIMKEQQMARYLMWYYCFIFSSKTAWVAPSGMRLDSEVRPIEFNSHQNELEKQGCMLDNFIKSSPSNYWVISPNLFQILIQDSWEPCLLDHHWALRGLLYMYFQKVAGVALNSRAMSESMVSMTRFQAAGILVQQLDHSLTFWIWLQAEGSFWLCSVRVGYCCWVHV